MPIVAIVDAEFSIDASELTTAPKIAASTNQVMPVVFLSRLLILVFPGVHGLDRDLRLETEGNGGAGTLEVFHLAPGERLALQVKVQRPGKVTGRRLDTDGKPVAGYRVSLGNHDVGRGQQVGGSWSTVPTDRDGCFVFVGIAPSGHKAQNIRDELVPAAPTSSMSALEPRCKSNCGWRVCCSRRFTRNLIGGWWVGADNQAEFAVRDPATDAVLATVPDCGAAETARAIDAASAALPGWLARPPAITALLLLCVSPGVVSYARPHAPPRP